MNALTVDTSSWLRLGFFLGAFLLLAVAEFRWPRRQPALTRRQRWGSNLGLSALNSLAVRLCLPMAGVGAALWAEQTSTGLFNQLSLPAMVELLLFIVAFDLTIYWQHRLFHAVPLLWRLHRVHHTDEDYDLTTGNRFHPVSILLSALVKSLLVLALGASAAAILTAEILLNVTSTFNHSNITIPRWLDRLLRRVIVTPDMHRVHHSWDRIEHNRNFGFNFSLWDRLFGSYKQDPDQPHEKMPIGLSEFRGPTTHRLLSLLLQPLKSAPVSGDSSQDRP